jgi:YD repeat-containing protein
MSTCRGRGALALLAALVGCGVQDTLTVGGSSAPARGSSALTISLANEVGRLVTSGSGLRRTFQSYDLRGRVTAAEHVLAGATFTFGTTYGFPCATEACTSASPAASGSVVVSRTFPDGEIVHYTYDVSGAQQAITATPVGGGAVQPIVAKVLRNVRGQTTQVDYGDGTSTAHHYNDSSDLRLYQLETFVTASPSTVLQLFQYGFDGNANLTSLTDYCNEASTGPCTSSSVAAYSSTFSYDSRNQLTQAVRNGGPSDYAYDAIGDLISKDNIKQTYFPSGTGSVRPHALCSVGSPTNACSSGTTYAYDSNGNTDRKSVV